ncbi:hypothetical protein MP638_006188 [Amoeboaphelidium occidentale]|nr:hypothetical protein MP638_006188 [Amoeboaphelidium occidentale]
MALLGWVYYAYHFVFLRILFTQYAILLGLILLILFNCLFWLLLISYYKVIFTDPGSPPKDPTTSITAKRSGDPRHCRKCGSWKPDRSHHCRLCQKCVLKMDHHCPWVHNCVGFYNYKYFVLFLLYCSLLGLYTSLSIGLYLVVSGADLMIIVPGEMQLVFLTIVGVVFGLGLLGFFIMHLQLIFRNNSTIESFERHRYVNVKNFGRYHHLSQGDYINIFDIGWKENFKEIFGDDYRYWLIPVFTSKGDGVTFRFDQAAYEELTSRHPEVEVGEGIV